MFEFNSAFTEKEAERWARRTARGKLVYILIMAGIFLFAMLIVLTLSELVLEDRVLEFSYFKLVWFSICSLLVGYSNWWSGNAKYQSYLLDKKIKKGLAT